MTGKYQQITREQCKQLISKVYFAKNLAMPKKGWIYTIREALGMSGRQLGERLGVSRSEVSRLEAAELEGRVTMKRLREVAEAMECELVYAVIPKADIDSIIEDQVARKAKAIIGEASVHMGLESQQLSKKQNEKEFQRLKEDLMRDLPRDLWDD